MFNIAPLEYTVPVNEMNFATGTWTTTVASGVMYKNHTAASESCVVTMPIAPPRRTDIAGLQITSIKVPVRVANSSLTTAPTITLFRVNDATAIMSGTADITSTEITTTSDAASLTGADAQDRALTITVSSPNFDFSVDPSLNYALNVTLSADASTSLRVYPAKVYFKGLT